MEPKVTTDYNKAKIVVDFYKPNVLGLYVCSCYTPNATTQEEPEYLVKEVTFAQLKDHYADSNGKVNVSLPGDQEQYISFINFLNNCDKTEIELMCSEVINKLEGRTGYYSPTRKTA